MNFIRKSLLLVFALFLYSNIAYTSCYDPCSGCDDTTSVCADRSVITDGKAIAAFGDDRAYILTESDELYKWDPVALHWVIQANLAPDIKQLDILDSGKRLIGTQVNGIIREWSHVPAIGSAWSTPYGTSPTYTWVIHDPVTEETRGLLADFNFAWKTLETPTLEAGDPWYRFMPIGQDNDDAMESIWLIDKDPDRFKKWERGDINYFVTLNQSTGEGPFNIYYYGANEDHALARVTEPVHIDSNADDVKIKQISYSSDVRNLWCVATNGTPWRWDNEEQMWILSNARSDQWFEGEVDYGPLTYLLCRTDDYRVQTVYIDGEFRPLLIVFSDNQTMRLIIGNSAREDMFEDFEYFILEDRPDNGFDHVYLGEELNRKQVVRTNGRRAVRENSPLENALLQKGIIANLDENYIASGNRLIRR